MEFNLADLFESVARRVGSHDAVVAGARRVTYAGLDERADRLAAALAKAGVGQNDFVGLHLANCTEYLETMLACFKLRAIPVNVNYRYVADELRHLYADAGLVALVHHRAFADAVSGAIDAMAEQRLLLQVEDGSSTGGAPRSQEYEAALAAASPPDRWSARSGNDLYCVYTGGTTGMPKGVLWRHDDIFFAGMRGGDPSGFLPAAEHPGEVADRITGPGLVAIAAPPLMHASAHWLAFSILLSGGTLVLVPGSHFQPDLVWDLVEDEGANILVVVGDAMAAPLAEAAAARSAAGRPPDASSLLAIGSGGAVLSPVTKARLTELFPTVMVADQFGSSETGQLGGQPGADTPHGPPRLRVDAVTCVFDEELHPVVPGSGMVGRLARGGRVPLRYHGHPEASAATFVEADGQRWALPGDLATVDATGEIEILGRASLCINTGGEKVYPDEVEAAIKGCPGVRDVVVIGVPDPRWGQRVTAVLSTDRPDPPTTDDLRSALQGKLAGYKMPKQVVVVDDVHRSPTGKADYRWALAAATSP